MLEHLSPTELGRVMAHKRPISIGEAVRRMNAKKAAELTSAEWVRYDGAIDALKKKLGKETKMHTMFIEHPKKTNQISVVHIATRKEKIFTAYVMSWTKDKMRKLDPMRKGEKAIIDKAIAEHIRIMYPHGFPKGRIAPKGKPKK